MPPRSCVKGTHALHNLMAVLFALWATTLSVAHLFAAGCLLHLLRRARPDLFVRRKRPTSSEDTAPLRQLSIDKGTVDADVTDGRAPPANTPRIRGSPTAHDAHAAQLPDSLVLRKASAAKHLQLEWRDLGCAVRTGGAGGVLHVLQGIWGRARSGEMQALVGPSGAGEAGLNSNLDAALASARQP